MIGVIAAGSEVTAQAGAEMLARNGNAVDAIVAAALATAAPSGGPEPERCRVDWFAVSRWSGKVLERSMPLAPGPAAPPRGVAWIWVTRRAFFSYSA